MLLQSVYVCAKVCVGLQFPIANFKFNVHFVCFRPICAMSGKENKRPRNGNEVQRANVVKLNVGGKDGSLNKRASEHALRRAEY